LCAGFLATVPPQSRSSLEAAVEKMLRDRLVDAVRIWTVDHDRLRLTAAKPVEEAP
jgi:hypothetical protein